MKVILMLRGISAEPSHRFRWCSCQLEILRKLNTESTIRKALGELPKTIEETYERILCSIPTDSRPIAHKAFQWLLIKSKIERLETLAQAIYWKMIEILMENRYIEGWQSA
jgi:hypothetical protein